MPAAAAWNPWPVGCAAAIAAMLVLALDTRRRLRRARRDVADLQEALVDARLDALRRELQPHFLVSTLNAVSELIYANPRAADEMIARLSALLRHAFQPGQPAEASLAEESRLLELYLDIMRLRFAERLFVRVDVPPALGSARVPRLMLQALVENALRHASDPSLSLVSVLVSAREEDGALVVRVRDRGAGTRRDPEDEAGLANTAERIAQLYGGEFGLSVNEAPERGAEVSVRLPLRRMTPGELAAGSTLAS